ncbi:hypothetical protein GJ496_005498 [Pomphorhynchus laevis]|nr:hypothetical protein GJ496_005498 [Pomphorhynchus laevis]
MGLLFSTIVMGSVWVMGQPPRNESDHRQDLNPQKYVLIPMTEYDEITAMGHEIQQIKANKHQQMMLPEIMKPLFPERKIVLDVIEIDSCEGYEARSNLILLPHPSSDTKFLMCISKKMAVAMDCALGTRFNELTMECNRFAGDPLEFQPVHKKFVRSKKFFEERIRPIY